MSKNAWVIWFSVFERTFVGAFDQSDLREAEGPYVTFERLPHLKIVLF